ncbi:MAG TPA: alpha/beta fold hydrolase, partial [Burkholderiaceae bacterium]
MSLWLDLLGATVRYVETPGFGRVRIVEAGAGKPEALFLMHGIGGHLEAYAKNVLALSAHYHVVAFDFVGHGLSDKPLDIDYLPATYARQLAELMDALGIARANISGESLGGWVAGTFAVMFPDRVKRLILNTTGGIPIVSEKGRRDLQNLEELSRRNVGQVPTIETVRRRMQWLMHESNWPLLDDELVG